MKEKSNDIKKIITPQNNEDIYLLVDKKVDFFKDVIQKTIINVQKNKLLDIIGINDVNNCIEKTTEINKKILEINNLKKTNDTDKVINFLQVINNDLSSLFKNYGTNSLDDFLLICLGNNSKIFKNNDEFERLELLKKYFHPTSYKIITKK